MKRLNNAFINEEKVRGIVKDQFVATLTFTILTIIATLLNHFGILKKEVVFSALGLVCIFVCCVLITISIFVERKWLGVTTSLVMMLGIFLFFAVDNAVILATTITALVSAVFLSYLLFFVCMKFSVSNKVVKLLLIVGSFGILVSCFKLSVNAAVLFAGLSIILPIACIINLSYKKPGIEGGKGINLAIYILLMSRLCFYIQQFLETNF